MTRGSARSWRRPMNLQAQETPQTANIAAAAAQLDGNRATALRNRLEADRQHKLLATRIARTEQAGGRSGYPTHRCCSRSPR